ncbi:PREDICTED: uncharacterized protein LOC108545526 [Eufriesea mexicana]|uniref:uncharacterized protein LOC108545526 n=1 Tax=Eufriesea mexicana TaxID=516756 RepID=UPI00083C495B|nr:PREDICTED: uncharacterized protein LOC108545526 [Eufriesea mexicana]
MIHRRRILSIFLSLVILVTLPCYESRARNTQSTQKLIRNRESYKLHENNIFPNYVEDNWEKGNFHIEQRDKSWVSISMHKKNNYVHESSLVNFTYNHTKDGQQLIHNEQSLTHRRFKRGVIHLYNMVVCATGCNPLAYKGYGCYCGFLGSGYVIDGIDRCCKMHDWCYDATECPMFSEYFVPYYWRCYHGYKPVCAVEHGNWGGSGSCAQRLCECDRSFAECLKRYPCPTTKAVCTSSPWRLVQNLFMIM